jgi:PDZ domain-containing protein/gag-polyprotein putative aspartyl protease
MPQAEMEAAPMQRWFFGLVLVGVMIPVQAQAPRPAATSFKVPFRVTVTKHVLVRAKINGQGPFHFLIDTGAPTLYIAPATCRKLNVRPDGDGWGTFNRFELEGGATVENAKGKIEEPFQIEGMNKIGLAGVELHGVIGYTLLARFRIELDFTRDWMKWTPTPFEPGFPEGLDGTTPAGVDALAGLAKLMATIQGKKDSTADQQRGFLGIELTEAKAGVAITAVLPDSPAERAGLQPGDRITHCQDQEVAKIADLHRLTRPISAGQSIRLSIRRGTETRRIEASLDKGF